MLIVHYEQLKHYDGNKHQWLGEKGQNAIDQRKQADTLGWLMMSIGVYEITEKNATPAASSRIRRAQSVTIVMRLKAAMFLKLYKMHNIEGWQLLKILDGSRPWPC